MNNDIKLRDQRKPGWCWQDNELYDAFGPVVGHHAVTVYTHMTRNCYGTEVRRSSRELARDSGLSKDTVLRAIRVMERVGMLRSEGSGPRMVTEYHLVDLKELAQHHGGTFDRRRTSYVFSESLIASLRVIASGIESVSGSDSLPAGPDVTVQNIPVAGRDSVGSGSDSQPSALAPALALGKPTSGARDGFVSLSASQDSRQQDNPPAPATAGELREAESIPESIERKIAAVRAQRAALPVNSAEWWKVSRELQALLAVIAPPEPGVETGADPPLTPGRRRRRHG